MLVLSRKNSESVVVCGPGEHEQLIKVTVLAVRGRKVKLGFEAAEDIPILRNEVWGQVQSQDSQLRCHG
jgi:carbon storage regulator CsrA